MFIKSSNILVCFLSDTNDVKGTMLVNKIYIFWGKIFIIKNETGFLIPNVCYNLKSDMEILEMIIILISVETSFKIT